MKKKFIAVLSACALMIMTLTGCGGEDDTDKTDNGKEKLTIGTLTYLNASEERYNEIMEKLEKSYRPSKANISVNYKYFDSSKDLLLALNSNQVDYVSAYESVANYLIDTNKDLEILKSERNLSDDFCFAFRKGDTVLQRSFNKAIKGMFDDGKLGELSKKYILDLKDGKEPPKIDIEKIPDADTIKVAVTGDLPPMDYIKADGQAAGFNTAILAEISKRIGKNIEIVSVDSAARASILTSGGADVIFWVSVPKDSTLIPPGIDTPEGVILSDPYYSDTIIHVAKKN
ncbi:MAG: transporter substrate-binding domain-containing protein [Selenomonadaceae bacterium]|nr:transporter substrate-binding domain-containing protein [Selenomonadaceae bacterium]